MAVFALAVVANAADIRKTSVKTRTALTGGAHNYLKPVHPVAPTRPGVARQALDLVGTAYDAGTSYWDEQHNGTAGKMIAVDEMGYIHMVWTKLMNTDYDNGQRHVYYNIFDPASNAFMFGGGVQVDNAPRRAGYTCTSLLSSGWVVPAFHTIKPDDPESAHTEGAMDLQPGMGIFASTRIPFLYQDGLPIDILWPKVAVGRDSTVHMASSEDPASGRLGDPQRIYYSRGHLTWDNDGYGTGVVWEQVDGLNYFKEIDTVMVIGVDIAASTNSDRVAMAWPKSRTDLSDTATSNQHDNDIYIMISEDGGYNWYPEVNITQFVFADTSCQSGDTAVCDRDTMRVYTDCCALFDCNDRLHVGFTTKYFWTLEGTISRSFSDIWHWGEEHNEISNIVHGEFTLTEEDTIYWMDAGEWQLLAQRPSLSFDTASGYLYCSYMYYDSEQVSLAGFPQGDALVSVSRNGGRTWSQGINVTQTDGGIDTPAGECLSERDITISERVTYINGTGYVHMSYTLDLDAGAGMRDEGGCYLDSMKYQQIPVNDIPALPLNPWWSFNIHADSSQMPGRIIALDPTASNPINCHLAADDPAFSPTSFHLYQNYPNPFNPTTNIQFDLVKSARVTLKVYNVIGQAVATLYDSKMMNAGVQTVAFDASNLASGVYVYRIEVDGIAASHKMVLMK